MSDLILVCKERVLRVLAGIEYIAEHDVHVYSATRMTHQMTDRFSIAMVKFMFVLSKYSPSVPND